MKEATRAVTRWLPFRRRPAAAFLLVACAALLAGTHPLHAQTANTPASIDTQTPAEAGEGEPEKPDKLAAADASPAEQDSIAEELRALRLELDALVRYDDTPGHLEDAESRLIDLSGDALDAREAVEGVDGVEGVQAKRTFAEIELRARHTLVRLAAERGQPIQTSIRSTQLRAAASRLAEADADALARLGHFYLTAAALGELQRDPSAAGSRIEVAEDRLRRLSRFDSEPAPGPEDPRNADETGDADDADKADEADPTDGDAPRVDTANDDASRAARIALAVLRGNVGQRPADNALVREAARLQSPPAARPALARYRSRADRLDPPIRLAAVLPPAGPDADAEANPDADAAPSDTAADPETKADPETAIAPDAAPDADAARDAKPDSDAPTEASTDAAPPRRAAGPITIVHYFQNGRPASLTPLFALRNLRRAYEPRDLEIVSVSLGPVVRWPEEANWPVRVSHGGSLGVAKLRVEVVPTFAVFGREGRLTMIGESPVVLEHAEAILERDDNATP